MFNEGSHSAFDRSKKVGQIQNGGIYKLGARFDNHKLPVRAHPAIGFGVDGFEVGALHDLVRARDLS